MATLRSSSNGFRTRVMRFTLLHATITGWWGVILCYGFTLIGIITTVEGIYWIGVNLINPNANGNYQSAVIAGGVAIALFDVFFLNAWFFQGDDFHLRTHKGHGDGHEDNENKEFFANFFHWLVFGLTLFEIATTVIGLLNWESPGIRGNRILPNATEWYVVAGLIDYIAAIITLFSSIVGTIIAHQMIEKGRWEPAIHQSSTPAMKQLPAPKVTEQPTHQLAPVSHHRIEETLDTTPVFTVSGMPPFSSFKDR